MELTKTTLTEEVNENNVTSSNVPELKVEKTEIVNDLNFIEVDGEWKITSLEIARFTGKRHYDVLESIRNMESNWIEVTERKFPFSEYKDSTGRSLPYYIFNEKEAVYVISKFNDKIRAKVVDAFYKLKEMYEKGEITQTSSIVNTYLESIKELIKQNNKSLEIIKEKDAQIIKEREAQTAQIQKMIDLHEKLIYSITDKREINEDKEYRLKLKDLKDLLRVNSRFNLTKLLTDNGIIEYNEVDEYLDFTEEYKDCGERGNNNILYYNKKGINVVKKLIDKMRLSN